MQRLRTVTLLDVSAVAGHHAMPAALLFLVEPTRGEQDIVVTTSTRYICVCCMCVHPSGFVWAITCTFMHGFQINLTQLFSLMSRSAI